MKVFIWSDVDNFSDNYHSEGSVVVFAETEERARDLANSIPGCNIKANELPDDVRETEGSEAVHIMPNAGCY